MALYLFLDDRLEFLMPLFPCLIILAGAVLRLVRIARGLGRGRRDTRSIEDSAPPRPAFTLAALASTNRFRGFELRHC